MELVADIRVPDGRGDAVVPLEIEAGISITVDEVELGVALRMPRGRVDVQTTEVSAPLEIEIGAPVNELLLVPEDNKSPLCNLDTKS